MKALETERLILRKYKEDDFAAVHSYGSIAENTTYMLFGPNSEEQTRDYIANAIREAEDTPVVNYRYAVTLKDTGKLIGGCDIHITDNAGEIGWIIHRDYWSRGYGTEIGKELLRYSFDELKLWRITARCDADNTGSYRIMEKIGMRREGLFFDVRPPHKQSGRKRSDELHYAILKDEWDTQKEIAFYNALPYTFDGFLDVPDLYNRVIHLICTKKSPGNPEKNWKPSYHFVICKGRKKIGNIDIRVGYGGGEKDDNLYYGGHIGYGIDEKYRGNGYAAEACRLLLPIAKAHKMTKLLITNNYTNTASKRVCEKLGARLIRTARLPEWNDLYKEGQRFVNVFEWSVD